MTNIMEKVPQGESPSAEELCMHVVDTISISSAELDVQWSLSVLSHLVDAGLCKQVVHTKDA